MSSCVFGDLIKNTVNKCEWKGGDVPAGHSDKSIDGQKDGRMDRWMDGHPPAV